MDPFTPRDESGPDLRGRLYGPAESGPQPKGKTMKSESNNAPRIATELVVRVYRSFKAENPGRDQEVTQFTLQCVIAMFAENIGLLPRQYFTNLLYQGGARGDASDRVAELFRQMSTPDGHGEIRFFNGGLFKNPVALPINPTQLTALTTAAEAEWSFVDPHIFGAVFTSIMDGGERAATGAHYTATEDIMRVVGPTIVEPWRKRLRAAKTLVDLKALQKELTQFRVLDPACGSGNFLYVAFRELYAIETEMLVRMQELPSIADDAQARSAWESGILTTNFHGIDVNPVAVDLARATLNIAKKIAFNERHELASERLDPSLPLDNLDSNIRCADALFSEWPNVDAIVGNPPILGKHKIRKALGREYQNRLKTLGAGGEIDLSCFWFRLAHDRLPVEGRAGFVGTSSLRTGKSRVSSLDYIVSHGATITNAVSSMPWSGDAALGVCVVNWVKGPAEGPHSLVVDGRVYSRTHIPSHLQLHADVSGAKKLEANKSGTSPGVIFGSDAFIAPDGWLLQERGKDFVRPVATGTAMLTSTLSVDPAYGIYLVGCQDEQAAADVGGQAFAHLKENLFPAVKERAESDGHYAHWIKTWWKPYQPHSEFFTGLAGKGRMIACSNTQARPIFAFLSTAFVPTCTMQVFAYDDDYSFGIIQSKLHWEWAKAKGGKVRTTPRYTADVWRTFPWPQQPPASIVERVAAAARVLRETRRAMMAENNWHLRALYQAADVPPGPHPLKDAQALLDEAVAAAYSLPPGQDLIEFLLDLNLSLAEREEHRHAITGPGLPPGFDPLDRRWMSDDCIEPPPANSP